MTLNDIIPLHRYRKARHLGLYMRGIVEICKMGSSGICSRKMGILLVGLVSKDKSYR